jgi:serine/threonine protein kinase
MLMKNPNDRPSATECLKHPWLSIFKTDEEQSMKVRRIKQNLQ